MVLCIRQVQDHVSRQLGLYPKVGKELGYPGRFTDRVVGRHDGRQVGLLVVVLSVQEQAHASVEGAVKPFYLVELWVVGWWMHQAYLQLGGQLGEQAYCGCQPLLAVLYLAEDCRDGTAAVVSGQFYTAGRSKHGGVRIGSCQNLSFRRASCASVSSSQRRPGGPAAPMG